MAKREYIELKKQIEVFMDQDFESAFPRYNDKEDQTHNIQVRESIYQKIDEAIEIAKTVNEPDFFNYLLGDVFIEKTSFFNKKHIWTEKKFFNISWKNKKKHFFDRLLFGLVNIASEGSQAYKVRVDTIKLEILGHAGDFRSWHGANGCIIDLKYINNFINLESLTLYHLSNVVNTKELESFKKLTYLEIEGNTRRVGGSMYNDSCLISETIITERFPVLNQLKTLIIDNVINEDLDFISNLNTLEISRISHCHSLVSLNGLNSKKLQDFSLYNLQSLNDISALRNMDEIIRMSFSDLHILQDVSAIRASTVLSFSLSKVPCVVDFNCLDSWQNCQYLSLDILWEKNMDSSTFWKDAKKIKSTLSEVDLKFLEKMTNLDYLKIIGGDASRVESFSKLKNLRYFLCNKNNFANLNFLSSNQKLEEVYLKKLNLQDITTLENCENLVLLELINLTNLKELPDFKNKEISIQFNGSRPSLLNSLENFDGLRNVSLLKNYRSKSYTYDNDSYRKRLSEPMYCASEYDKDGFAKITYYEDGSDDTDSVIQDNTLTLIGFEKLNNIKGLQNVTNIMKLEFKDCISLLSLDGIDKMLDLREIWLENCTELVGLHILNNCKKIEKIIISKSNSIKPKPRLKKMDTKEKVQEYLNRL